MNTSKIKKGQQGFTLVEVIVVAIIVAALAAVAVPMYTSYVTSSRKNAAANAAGSVASFMGSCLNQTGAVTGVTSGTETPGTAAVALTCTQGTTTLSTMQLPIGIKFKINKLDNSVATAGTVEATHVDSPTGTVSEKYNY